MLFLRDILRYAAIYMKHGKGKLALLIIITISSGFVELLGISMLLPLLNLSFDANGNDNMLSKLLQQGFDAIGIEVTLNNILIILLVIFSLKGITIFLQKYYTGLIAITVRKNLQISLENAVKSVNYQTFSKINAGNITNILTKETAGFASSFSEFARMGSCLVYIGFYMLAFGALKPEITLILFICTAIIYIALKGLVRKTKKVSIEATKAYGDISDKSIEVLHNYIYLKATNKLQRYTEYIIEYIESIQVKERKLMFFAALVTAIKEPIAVFALIALIFYQVSIMGEPLTEIMIIGLLLYRMLNQVLLLQGQWQRFNTCIGSLEIIEDTLANFTENKEKTGKITTDKIPMPIIFDNVNFHHGSTQILDNVSLTIEENKAVGIVGPSGSGKTTIFHLITGLIAPNDGKIIFGDIPYTEINKPSIREKIGYIAQDPAIFTGTIKDNLILDQSNITDSAIEKALKEASCLEFMDILDKQVGDQGKNLSGGQKQRLSIARELLKNPEMLIFDEATSALDSLSDEVIRQSIAKMHGKRTMVLITHRLSSVEFCDIIYVLDKGKIIESGSYKELISNKKSFFHGMYHKQ